MHQHEHFHYVAEFGPKVGTIQNMKRPIIEHDTENPKLGTSIIGSGNKCRFVAMGCVATSYACIHMSYDYDPPKNSPWFRRFVVADCEYCLLNS